MDDVTFSKKTNISAIYRFDQHVKDIIISASQVALYVFDAKKTRWIKRKVEGACFFYKRKTSPKYGIFILNRLDTTNFIELINSAMEIQLQEPFILYRSIFKTIYGIWFYEKSECIAMANVFERIIFKLKEQEKDEQDEDDDILLKDQSCATENVEQNTVEKDARFHERKPSGQPESVRKFFAIASKEATKNQPVLQPSSVQNPVCNKTICNSFQSVAHIEKTQTKPSNVNVIENSMKSLNLGGNFDQFCKVSPVNFMDNVEPKLPCHSNILKEELTSEFPELIPPRMLVTPYDLSASISNSDVTTDKNSRMEVLSKHQMLQAMEYLLKNDSQFVDKLYDAYLKVSKN